MIERIYETVRDNRVGALADEPLGCCTTVKQRKDVGGGYACNPDAAGIFDDNLDPRVQPEHLETIEIWASAEIPYSRLTLLHRRSVHVLGHEVRLRRVRVGLHLQCAPGETHLAWFGGPPVKTRAVGSVDRPTLVDIGFQTARSGANAPRNCVA